VWIEYSFLHLIVIIVIVRYLEKYAYLFSCTQLDNRDSNELLTKAIATVLMLSPNCWQENE